MSQYAVRKTEQLNAAFQTKDAESDSPKEAVSCFGLEEGSIKATRVIVLKDHCVSDLREGEWFRVKGLQPRIGNENQFSSTEGCSITALNRTPVTLPHLRVSHWHQLKNSLGHGSKGLMMLFASWMSDPKLLLSRILIET